MSTRTHTLLRWTGALLALATLACSFPLPSSSQDRSRFLTRHAVQDDVGVHTRRYIPPVDAGATIRRRNEELRRGEGDDDDDENRVVLPSVGAPYGDFFQSTKELQCEDLRISFGGGMGPPYAVSIVNGSTLSPNASLDDVEVLARVGILGMPGVYYFSGVDELETGSLVALQIVDSVGGVGYSVTRHVVPGHLNEFCHRPGLFWPPSRWDSTHFLIILFALILVVPLSTGLLSGVKEKWAKRRDLFSRSSTSNAEGDGDVPLQERRGGEEGVAHVLGEDDERTSLEDEDRPLLRSEGGSGAVPAEAPPVYDEAVKEEDDWREGENRRRSEGEERRS
ncbi:hypothetical protein JCM8547_001008 [Rhodosporidiobolus lusitaniae]